MSALGLMLTPAQAMSAMELLDEPQAAKLELLAGEVADVLRLSEGVIGVVSEAGVHGLNNLLGRAAKAIKELDALRRSRVDPLNAEVGHVNGLFRPMTVALEALTAKGKQAIASWQRAERAREQREREETNRRLEEAAAREARALISAAVISGESARDEAIAEAEAARQEVEAILAKAPEQTPKGYRSDEATTSVKARWVFEVVKPEMLPREYLEPAVAKIRAAVAAGVREIPGVDIREEDQVVVRPR